jgi:hypothetical protein
MKQDLETRENFAGRRFGACKNPHGIYGYREDFYRRKTSSAKFYPFIPLGKYPAACGGAIH